MSKSVAGVTIKIMETTAKVRAVIINSGAMHYEAIIGRDFLDQAHVMLIKRQDSIIIRDLSRIEKIQGNLVEACSSDEITGIEQMIFGDIDEGSKILCRDLIRSYTDRISTSMQNSGRQTPRN